MAKSDSRLDGSCEESWYLVKWLKSADWHSSWVRSERLSALAKIKLRNFERRLQQQGGGEEEESNADCDLAIIKALADAEESPWSEGDAEHVAELEGFGLLGTRAHRVLASEPCSVDGKRDDLKYLVKWASRPYDECTWELGCDVAVCSQDLVAAFEERETEGVGAFGLEQLWRKSGGGKEADSQATTTRRQACDAKKKKKQQRSASAAAAQEAASSSSPAPHVAGLVEDCAQEDDGTTVGKPLLSQPSWLTGGVLHPYQLEGVNWLRSKWLARQNVILADEMGLGKTIQAAGLVASVAIEHGDGGRKGFRPSLVVAPLSTLANWERELAKWCEGLNVVVLSGNSQARRRRLNRKVGID